MECYTFNIAKIACKENALTSTNAKLNELIGWSYAICKLLAINLLSPKSIRNYEIIFFDRRYYHFLKKSEAIKSSYLLHQ